MKISIIAAMGTNRGLGFGNKLPWYLPDDLKRFKKLTDGHAVVMGRKTHESIGRPLPNRRNIVVTRNRGYKAEGCLVVGSMEEAIRAAENNATDNDDEIFVIGGAEIYALALPVASRMYLTFVDANVPADVFFPKFDEREWRIVSTENHDQDEKHPYAFVWNVYERKK